MNKIMALLAIGVIALFAGCTQQYGGGNGSSGGGGTPGTNVLTYESTQYGLKMNYPSDWTKKVGYAGTIVAFASPLENAQDKFAENVNIVIDDTSAAQGVTLDESKQAVDSN